MRRFILAVAVLVALLSSIPAEAVDLQAGWYAQIRSVNVYAYDSNNRPYLYGDGWFYSSLGDFGPFLVTDEPYNDPQICRTVRVPNDAYNVVPGTSVEMPIGAMPQRVAYLSVAWETNYDASKMRLELVQRQTDGSVTTVWTQNTSGYYRYSANMAYGINPNGIIFRVVTVPEPSTFFGLSTSLLSMCIVAIRRRTPRCG